MNKFDLHSIINYINLEESIDRRNFMENQFHEYGITHYKSFVTKPFDTYKNNCKITGRFIDDVHHHGTTITFLRCIKNWLDDTNEEYGIFIEDDTSFETSKYWSFTWSEFVNSLPVGWDIIQVIRLNDWGDDRIPQLSFRSRNWDDWGASCIMTRSYAIKLISSYMINDTEYHLDILNTNLMPIVENILFCGLGSCYNIPLFIECDLPSTYKRGYDAIHELSKQKYKELWINSGLQTPVTNFYLT
jgi:hypothetical protein